MFFSGAKSLPYHTIGSRIQSFPKKFSRPSTQDVESEAPKLGTRAPAKSGEHLRGDGDDVVDVCLNSHAFPIYLHANPPKTTQFFR